MRIWVRLPFKVGLVVAIGFLLSLYILLLALKILADIIEYSYILFIFGIPLGLFIIASLITYYEEEKETKRIEAEYEAIRKEKQKAISNLCGILEQEVETRNNSKWLLFSYSNEHEVLGEYNTVEEYIDTLEHYKRIYKGKVCEFPNVGGYYGTKDKLYIHITHYKTMIMMKECDYKRSSDKR